MYNITCLYHYRCISLSVYNVYPCIPETCLYKAVVIQRPRYPSLFQRNKKRGKRFYAIFFNIYDSPIVQIPDPKRTMLSKVKILNQKKNYVDLLPVLEALA